MEDIKEIKPNWDEISLKIGSHLSHEELNAAWCQECDLWLNSLAKKYGNDYHIQETSNFYILSNEAPRYIQVFSDSLERTLKRIMSTLQGMASDEGYGKHVAIIFSDIDQYYDYVGLFYPEEGEFGFSSGMFINDGYGHFVFFSQDMDTAEIIAVHELTHACLSHLPIPTWLNEGLAVLMEDVLAGQGLILNKEMLLQHQNYWNETTIQAFWSGDSFFAADEGQELSYHLAHILVRNICKQREAFADFVNHADALDAGSSAMHKSFGLTLSELAGSFLGLGKWDPKE